MHDRGTLAVTIAWLTGSDVAVVEAASHLFDNPVQPAYAVKFLHEPTHHLAIAYVDGAPAGFVSGVEIHHPGQGTEMLLYELGIDEAFRGRGLGKALVAALRDHAIGLACRGMWVLTDHDNEAALATYRGAGAGEPTPNTLLQWTF